MQLDTRPGSDGHSVVYVSGEIDLQSADELRDAGIAAAAASQHARLDLSGVTFIDSSGLAALIAINNEVQASATALSLLNPSSSVQRLFYLTGLTAAFDIVDQPTP